MFHNGRLSGEGLYLLDARHRSDCLFQRVVPVHGKFFRNNGFAGNILLNADMPPKAEYFSGNLSLKAIHKRKCNNQCHNTDSGCHNRQANDKGRKGAAAVECQFTSYVECQLQISKLCCKTTLPPAITQKHFRIM